MSIVEDAFGTLATGAVVAVAAAVVVPVLLPVAVSVGRPLLKTVIKGALLAYARGQEVVGELTETVEDLTAEARAEMQQSGNGARGRAGTAIERQGPAGERQGGAAGAGRRGSGASARPRGGRARGAKAAAAVAAH